MGARRGWDPSGTCRARGAEWIDYCFDEAYDLRMTSPGKHPPDDNDVATLKRELEKGLASGISTRTPEQIREAARERSIIEGIERGRADLRAGNTVPHDVAMAELFALIDGLAGPGCGNR